MTRQVTVVEIDGAVGARLGDRDGEVRDAHLMAARIAVRDFTPEATSSYLSRSRGDKRTRLRSSQLSTPGRTTPGRFSSLGTPGKFSQLSSPGREKLALSPAIDPDIEAYAQWLEDKITREAENVGFLEGRGHSPYKS